MTQPPLVNGILINNPFSVIVTLHSIEAHTDITITPIRICHKIPHTVQKRGWHLKMNKGAILYIAGAHNTNFGGSSNKPPLVIFIILAIAKTVNSDS